MSKDQKYSIDNLLNDNGFIDWVISDDKQENQLWSKTQARLKGEAKTSFENAIQIINKIRTLNIDNENELKSPEFIQQQYIRLLEASSNKESRKSKVIRLNRFQKYAAAIVVLISISSAILFSISTKSTFANHLTEVDLNISDLLIQTSNNTYFKIDDNTNKKWITENGVFVSVDANEINFSETDKIKSDITNTYKIIVPKGKVYNVNLIDGTSVELNSNTNIVFNNSTTSKYRNVAIKGEAFFDVAHNKERPFTVQSSDMKIEVLGTEFNVSNYETNNYSSTTLVEGTIKVYNLQGESHVIKPGDQARLYRNQNKIQVNHIDVQDVVAWTSSRMVFTNKKLENLIPKLNKWYDTEFIILGDNLKEYSFTGTLKRENELTYFLEILKYTEGINYEISEGQVKLTLEE